jgi:hypothetical protein
MGMQDTANGSAVGVVKGKRRTAAAAGHAIELLAGCRLPMCPALLLASPVPLMASSASAASYRLFDGREHAVDVVVELRGVESIEDDDVVEGGHQLGILLPLPYHQP